MQHIDTILYINLAHRTDRNDHIIQEIHKLCTDSLKIHRIDAVKHNEGALGCGLSHIKTLEYVLEHPEWKTVLILEDDFTFRSSNVENTINDLFQTFPDIDVGLLSYNHTELKCTDTMNPLFKKINYSQTTSSYIIRQSYVPTLLQNLKESTEDMQKNGKRHENCIDIYWTRLQPEANWIAVYPAIGYQYDNYSDIEHRVTTYGC
jgi:GR25 family glycosyltransferase involved in LPS biosynthesis